MSVLANVKQYFREKAVGVGEEPFEALALQSVTFGRIVNV